MPTPTTLSILLLADKAAVVADTTAPGAAPGAPLGADTDPVAWSFLSRGMRLLPGFFGAPIPDGTDLRLVVRGARVVLATAEGSEVLEVPLDDAPPGWLDAAQTHGGALVFVGRDIGVAAAADAPTAARAVHEAAVAGRIVGAIVELAVL